MRRIYVIIALVLAELTGRFDALCRLFPQEINALRSVRVRLSSADEQRMSIDRESLEKAQFESFKKNQVGKWVGVHTGYDPEGEP
jgi:hypothetical protein